MTLNLDELKCSNAAVTVRDMVDIGELYDSKTKGGAAFRLIVRRTNLSDDATLDLTASECTAVLNLIGDKFREADGIRALGAYMDAEDQGRCPKCYNREGAGHLPNCTVGASG